MTSSTSTNRPLVVAGAASFAAAALHLACIVGGAPWYRALGAGERMAQMAASGHWYPPTSAAVIAAILATWGAYAWSGAGLVRRLPLLRTGLVVITTIYLVRGVAFAPLQPYFPGNSTLFWLVSSGICLGIGVLHALGLRRAWARLGG